MWRVERVLGLERETAGVAIDFEPGSFYQGLGLERETGFAATSTGKFVTRHSHLQR